MTEKRFELIELYGDDHLIDNETNEKIGYDLHSPSTFNANWNNVCNLLNTLHEENQQLKRADNIADLETQIMHLKQENQELRLQLNQCADQRNEFHRGARENANRVGKLEKENEQLKSRVEKLETLLHLKTEFERDIKRKNE